MTLWYISFAGAEGFRGATVVAASSSEGAYVEAMRRNLHPGGEAGILPVPQKHEGEARLYLNRLVSLEELIAHGGKKIDDLPVRAADAIYAAAHFIDQKNSS
jgi:hypothetical protein